MRFGALSVKASKAQYGAVEELDSEEGLVAQIVRHPNAVVFTLFVCLATVAEGYDFGVLNGALVLIADDFKCPTWQIATLVSVTPLFVIVGTAIGSSIGDHCGRWRALLLTCVVLVCGPLYMALAPGIWNLVAGRCMVGLGVGMGLVIVSMYIAETAPKALRGPLTTLEDVFLNVGMVLGYFANWALAEKENNWRWMLASGMLPCALLGMFLAFYEVKESPRWLHMQGRSEESRAVLTYFLTPGEAAQALEEMQGRSSTSQEKNFVSWAELFTTASADRRKRAALFAGCTVCIGQMLCGMLVVAYYSSEILQKFMSEERAFLATTFLGLAKLVVGAIVAAVVEKVGRRTMLLASVGVTTCACVLLATSLQLAWNPYFHAAILCLYMAGYSLGLGPITFVYISEVFVSQYRAKSMALAMMCSRCCGVIIIFFFPLYAEQVGMPTAFATLGAFNVVLVTILYFTVVETGGHTLENVEQIF
mmetsp:Transcript_20686/g.57721  ORF Transcript_20686/g.57721 Transcript_20686/m.57721 type:complete len:478 (+) Transcript_20686:224-1657(+)